MDIGTKTFWPNHEAYSGCQVNKKHCFQAHSQELNTLLVFSVSSPAPTLLASLIFSYHLTKLSWWDSWSVISLTLITLPASLKCVAKLCSAWHQSKSVIWKQKIQVCRKVVKVIAPVQICDLKTENTHHFLTQQSEFWPQLLFDRHNCNGRM